MVKDSAKARIFLRGLALVRCVLCAGLMARAENGFAPSEIVRALEETLFAGDAEIQKRAPKVPIDTTPTASPGKPTAPPQSEKRAARSAQASGCSTSVRAT